MAGPLAGIGAAQIAQQKLPNQAAQQAQKSAPSKFDQAMKPQGADAAQKAGQVQASQQVQHVDKAKQIEQAGKIQKSSLNKVTDKMTAKGMDPVAQKNEVNKTKSLLSGMVENMEKGQVSIDKLIQGGLSGKNFSNTEMLAMQAGMYKYTQELELTGKVVEKATSGLKDTLKTQV
jgi:transcription termination factor NusB